MEPERGARSTAAQSERPLRGERVRGCSGSTCRSGEKGFSARPPFFVDPSRAWILRLAPLSAHVLPGGLRPANYDLDLSLHSMTPTANGVAHLSRIPSRWVRDARHERDR